jgi:hypothetical protein
MQTLAYLQVVKSTTVEGLLEFLTCDSVDKRQRFGVTCCLHLQGEVIGYFLTAELRILHPYLKLLYAIF